MTWKPLLASTVVVALVAGYVPEEPLAAVGGRPAVIEAIGAFLFGLSDAGVMAPIVVTLTGLTVVHYGLVKPGLTALIVTISLTRRPTTSQTRGGNGGFGNTHRSTARSNAAPTGTSRHSPALARGVTCFLPRVCDDTLATVVSTLHRF